jgi:hypothetical protein
MTLSRSGLVLALALAGSGVATADTIHLKNGRVIHTPNAKQVGDKVQFVQFGETVSIPASVVLRIERDERGEEAPLPAPVPAAPSGAPAEGQEEGGEEEAEELPPEANRSYWRERILAIRSEKAEIEESIVALRREERAFMFNGNMSTTEIRLKIEAAQARDKELDQEMVGLQREARLLGVPPGWLRVRAETTGS